MQKMLSVLSLCLLSAETFQLDLLAHRVGSPELHGRAVYAIYDAVLKDFATSEKTKFLSIVRSTTPPDGFCPLEQNLDTEQARSAMADLRTKNKAATQLQPMFRLPFKYELADVMEPVGGARLPPPGQDALPFIQEQLAQLERMNREGYAQVQLSTPGISKDGSVALVYISVSFAGETRMLRKKRGVWVVEPRPLCPWIS